MIGFYIYDYLPKSAHVPLASTNKGDLGLNFSYYWLKYSLIFGQLGVIQSMSMGAQHQTLSPGFSISIYVTKYI